MRFVFGKAWLVAGLAIIATACSGRVGVPPTPAAASPDPTPVLLAMESPIVAETTPPTPPTAVAVVATMSAPVRIPDPTDSPVAPTAPTSTKLVMATSTPEARPTLSDGMTLEQRQLLASLPSRGPAPELANATWLNTEPLRLADLRGKVVLLDMWTFG